MLQAKVEGYWDRGLAVFDPEPDFMEDDGLNLAEAVVEQDKSQMVTLVMENASYEPARLKKGRVLGQFSPITMAIATDEEDPLNEPVKLVSTLVMPKQVAPTPVERTQQLLKDLQPESETLSEEEKEKWRAFLFEYSHLFALDKSELGPTNIITHSIDTGDHPPIRQPVRRTPFALRQRVDDLVQEMLNQGVIQPSQSPWASPIVLVKKRDGDTRFCVDYRKLNSCTRKHVFLLPRIDNTLDLLSQSAYFTTLNLASGYWQVRMDEGSQEKTAFTTYSGLYEFNMMPFRLCNAPATFQRLMETILTRLTGKICMVYIDDMIVFSQTFEDQLSHLKQVMDHLHQAGLHLKPKKCKFIQERVEYLGHVISKHGIEVDPVKVAAIRDFPPPTNLKSLKSFIGLVSYYRRFIPNFSSVAGPLHLLTRKDGAFVWSSSCQEAFELL